jgi:hypothetical protein
VRSRRGVGTATACGRIERYPECATPRRRMPAPHGHLTPKRLRPLFRSGRFFCLGIVTQAASTADPIACEPPASHTQSWRAQHGTGAPRSRAIHSTGNPQSEGQARRSAICTSRRSPTTSSACGAIGAVDHGGPPPADNANLDGLRRAIMAWVSEWRRDDPDIDDAAIAIYEEAANDLVTNPNLDLSFGYWIQSELDKLVRQKRKGAGHGSGKRRSQDQPTLKDSSGSEE